MEAEFLTIFGFRNFKNMRKLSLLIIIGILCFSCKKETTDPKIANAQFDQYKNNFVENLWKVYPDWASSQGFHKYDSVMRIPDTDYRKEKLAFAQSNLDSLKNYAVDELSSNNVTDYHMIKNQLESTIFSINEVRSFEWDPSNYNVCGSFAEILNGNYDSLENRVRSISYKLDNVPAFYEAAKANIKNPTIEHTQLAIDQNTGGKSVFEADLIDAVGKSSLSDDEKRAILEKSKKAIVAIDDYVAWLKKLDNKTPRSFRLGKELYDKKFEFEIQSGYSPDEIYQKALTHKDELHQKMFALADKLWPKYCASEAKPTDKLKVIKQVIDKISLQHTTPEKFQSEIEKQIPELVAYVKAKDLLYIDPSKPLVVRKEPDYMAGVAGASVSAPGPYDKNANTYYNVGSMSGWDAAESESYLREYNDYILQILNIHEAVPGHYTQLVYANQSPSIIKSNFGNGAMVEGWAVYTERMMLESGYKNSDEMWLMYYKWNLRTTCNTILDYSIHTKNMSKEAALNLMLNEAFQQQAEADGKWKRATLTQVQLCSYFTGYTEIYEFREEQKKKLGDQFSLKKFHEKFLSYGSAPVKYIKELMTKENSLK
jgi:uncharacterized protein (DUF885 family)